jgi:dTDP-4-dehydrorhamnose reductase
MHLVVGSRGLVGSALCARLVERDIKYIGTTRQTPGEREIHCDLCSTSFEDLRARLRARSPEFVDAVYLVAAMPKFAACEGSALAWHVNVDAPLAIAAERLGFAVFVSSDAVENMGNTAYARQKAHVEAVLLGRGGAAIVRPGRVLPERVSELADLMIDVGLKRQPGVTRWQ